MLKNLTNKKKKIKKNILLVGSGRWSKITTLEIKKNFKQVNIFIYSKKRKQFKEWCKKKKIEVNFLKKLNQAKINNISHAIVINKNKDHYRYTKKLLLLGIKTLVEKPLVNKIYEFKKLYNLSKIKKTNLLVSLPFFYAMYFYFYKKKFLNRKVSLINFIWTDKYNEKRGGILKRQNLTNEFVDSIYHIFSILNIFFGKGNLNFNQRDFFTKENLLKFRYKKILVTAYCKRNYKKRSRKIIFFCNKDKIEINFSNNNLSKIFLPNKKKAISCPKNFQNLTLAYQILFFLNIKSYRHVLFNDVRNLKSFLYKKFEIQKKL